MNKDLLAIAFSDIHFHEWAQFNKDNFRLKIAEEVVTRVKEIAIANSVPIFFTGDLLQTIGYVSLPTLYYLIDAFSGGNYEMYGISGNHDMDKMSSKEHRPFSIIDILGKIFPNINCIDFDRVQFPEFTLWGIPYLDYSKEMIEAVGSITDCMDRNTKNVLLIHSDLPEAKDTNGRIIKTSNFTLDIFKSFDLVLSGHIHQPQRLGDNVIMIGAPNHQRKTDLGSKLGYWEIYKDMTVKFKRLRGLPEFIYGDKEGGGYNYVIPKPIKESKLSDIENKQFDDKTDPETLALNYCKVNGYKNKVRQKALINLLKEANG